MPDAPSYEDMVEKAYKRLIRAKSRTEMLLRAKSTGATSLSSRQEFPSNAFDSLYSHLIRQEHEAMLKLLKLGIALPNSEKKDKILDLVKESMLSEDHQVMQLISDSGAHPGRWSEDLENQIREEIDRAFNFARHEVPSSNED